MRIGVFLGIVGAIILHAGFILFGGLLFLDDEKDYGTLQQVELISDDVAAEKDQKKPEDTTEELETEPEDVPDAAEIIRNLEMPMPNDAPELEAASLSAIEAALNSAGGGGGDFANALDFASGGRIGGTGKAGALDEQLDNAFSLAEIDQKPRPVFQAAPLYPGEMRGKKVEGVVSVLFVVDSSGKVANPRVEKSSHPAFDKPAIEAVKKWRFEPAIKGGQRVACKMRAPIRFRPS
jgi:protein TonB